MKFLGESYLLTRTVAITIKYLIEIENTTFFTLICGTSVSLSDVNLCSKSLMTGLSVNSTFRTVFDFKKVKIEYF